MTLEEVREKIISSTNSEAFNLLELNLNFEQIGFVLHLKGVSSIYEFINQQVNGWNKKQENLPDELKRSKEAFSECKSQIIELIKAERHYGIESEWRLLTDDLEESNKTYFTYDTPEVDFLINVFNNHPNSFIGAYRFICNNISNNNNKDDLIGIIQAYEFTLKDHSKILERRNLEKGSIGRIRNDFYEYLTTTETEVVGFITKIKEKYDEYVLLIDELKNAKEVLFNEWFEISQKSNDKFNDDSNKKIEDLEKAYEALLSLKKPTDYWNKRATILKSEGHLFLKWLIGLVLFGCLSLYFLLWLTPDGMLLSFITGTASAIKWSIIYVTFISFIAFGIKSLSKVVFSSFHLARDAEEREQLTFVYLAMIKDASVDDKDKSLIIQALFSRADTGLLKDDSSPTMPGGLIEKIIQK